MAILKKILGAGACSAILMCAMSAGASVVTVGNLSTDSLTGLTTDTISGRTYTRLDAFKLTYANTLAAIAPGGAWAGWSIATVPVAEDFVAAALGVANTPCTAGNVSSVTACGTISGWSDGKLGASYDMTDDYFAYLDDPGYLGFVHITADGQVTDHGNAAGRDWVDGFQGATPIDYLLFQDAALDAAVPEPVSSALFGLGMLALGMALRRRRG